MFETVFEKSNVIIKVKKFKAGVYNSFTCEDTEKISIDQ